MTATRVAFVRAAPPLNGWRCALLAAGLIALLPSAARWLQQANALQQLEAQLAQAQPRRAPQPTLAPSQQREQDQQTKLVAEAVRQLNLPVARLLKTLQAPGDLHVALLGLDLNGQPVQDAATGQPPAASAADVTAATRAAAGVPAGAPAAASATPAAGSPSGTLKISAEAETAQDMLNYLVFLNQQQMFRSVYLVKHELAGGAAGQSYRFQLEAQWRQ
ncbi:hypothetical protein ASC94_23050 [Massilia sp. Root418]|jgi:hypothetical protein|uniref:hypothetical protein n=1 Tax=Massilia sp. Root418 TaxID=1736532 RepID=UPI0006FBF943|nr:hypothetical protein [Massilia sp. Root418]KQW89309.1 hypothetical protein ASC94_23050 [Massilia sp. Root418]